MKYIMIALSVMAILLLAQKEKIEPVMPDVVSHQPTEIRVDEDLINRIVTVAKVPYETARAIVIAAEELAYKDFPKKVDILAVIGVESTFQNHVSDGLGSCGLMQVNPAANKLDHGVVCSFPLTNMKHGVRILRQNYESTGSAKDALLVYNSGLGNFRQGIYKESYYHNFLSWKGKLHALRGKGN